MISVTSKSRYAVVALAELARSGERPVPIAQIAERRGMPVQFLEQLFTTLRRDGLLQSHRGVKGGYTLARPAQEINVLEVVQSLDGRVGEEGKEAGGIWERGGRGAARRLPAHHDRRHRPPRGRGGRRGDVPHLAADQLEAVAGLSGQLREGPRSALRPAPARSRTAGQYVRACSRWSWSCRSSSSTATRPRGSSPARPAPSARRRVGDRCRASLHAGIAPILAQVVYGASASTPRAALPTTCDGGSTYGGPHRHAAAIERDMRTCSSSHARRSSARMAGAESRAAPAWVTWPAARSYSGRIEAACSTGADRDRGRCPRRTGSVRHVGSSSRPAGGDCGDRSMLRDTCRGDLTSVPARRVDASRRECTPELIGQRRPDRVRRSPPSQANAGRCTERRVEPGAGAVAQADGHRRRGSRIGQGWSAVSERTLHRRGRRAERPRAPDDQAPSIPGTLAATVGGEPRTADGPAAIAREASSTVGNTPLVALRRLARGARAPRSSPSSST